MHNTSLPRLILASSSPYRKQLIDKLNVPYITASPNIDESRLQGENPLSLVRRLSVEKARTIASAHPNSLIIGSDQVAILDGKIIGKPGTAEKAKQQLLAQSGQIVRFITGVCVWDSDTGQHDYAMDTCEVRFRTLSKAQIQHYIAQDNPLNCAGSIKTEGLGITLLEYIKGSDPNTLIGLPLIQLTTLLKKQGFMI